MSRTKTYRKVGWYFSIACVLIMLLPTMTVGATPPCFSSSNTGLPSGTVMTQTSDNTQDPLSYGFSGDGLSDGGSSGSQRRQSQVVVSGYWEGNHLRGTSETMFIYYPISLDHYSLDLTGNVYWIYDDGSTRAGSWGWHCEWWSYEYGLPLLLIVTFNVYNTVKGVKSIFYDVDYYEDGLFVRHIQKVFNDKLSSSPQIAVPMPGISTGVSGLCMGNSNVPLVVAPLVIS